MPEQSVRELSGINLRLQERLSNREFRREWFRAELEDSVPEAYRELRVRRGLTQTELAQLVETKQPAICRFEQSNEAVWQFEFLLRMAEAMDARLRLVVEAAEDVISEYEEPPVEASALSNFHSLEQQSTLGNLNEAREHRGKQGGLPSFCEINEGNTVRLEAAERGNQSLQLPAFS